MIVAWSDWDKQVIRAFDRMESGDRAEIGGALPQSEADGDIASPEVPDVQR